jgi:predicted enzyme related to lactoylglutathione lyase
MMPDRKLLPGKFVWFEHVSDDSTRAQEFFGEVLGWKAKPFPMGDAAYTMILTGDTWDTMIGGYAPAKSEKSRWVGTVSVESVDAAAEAAAADGAEVLDAPTDLQGVGRRARIADPQAPPQDIPGIGRFGVFEDPTGAVLAVMKPLMRQNQT